MRPNISAEEDAVYIWWDGDAEVTCIEPGGKTTSRFRIPETASFPLYDEEEAKDYVVDLLKNADLSKKAWQEISDHLGVN